MAGKTLEEVLQAGFEPVDAAPAPAKTGKTLDEVMAAGFEPVDAAPAPAPAEAPKPEPMGVGKAALTGVATAVPFGDRISAVLRADKRIAGVDPNTGQPTNEGVGLAEAVRHPVDTFNKAKGYYNEELSKNQAQVAKAATDQPTATLLGSLAPMLVAGPTSATGSAVLNGLYGAANSKAPTLGGKVLDTGISAAFGAAGYKAPVLTAATTLAAGALGDKVGLSPEERQQLMFQGGFGLAFGGAAKTIDGVRGKVASRLGRGAENAEGQVRSNIVAEDQLTGKAMNKSYDEARGLELDSMDKAYENRAKELSDLEKQRVGLYDSISARDRAAEAEGAKRSAMAQKAMEQKDAAYAADQKKLDSALQAIGKQRQGEAQYRQDLAAGNVKDLAAQRKLAGTALEKDLDAVGAERLAPLQEKDKLAQDIIKSLAKRRLAAQRGTPDPQDLDASAQGAAAKYFQEAHAQARGAKELGIDLSPKALQGLERAKETYAPRIHNTLEDLADNDFAAIKQRYLAKLADQAQATAPEAPDDVPSFVASLMKSGPQAQGVVSPETQIAIRKQVGAPVTPLAKDFDPRSLLGNETVANLARARGLDRPLPAPNPSNPKLGISDLVSPETVAGIRAKVGAPESVPNDPMALIGDNTRRSAARQLGVEHLLPAAQRETVAKGVKSPVNVNADTKPLGAPRPDVSKASPSGMREYLESIGFKRGTPVENYAVGRSPEALAAERADAARGPAVSRAELTELNNPPLGPPNPSLEDRLYGVNESINSLRNSKPPSMELPQFPGMDLTPNAPFEQRFADKLTEARGNLGPSIRQAAMQGAKAGFRNKITSGLAGGGLTAGLLSGNPVAGLASAGVGAGIGVGQSVVTHLSRLASHDPAARAVVLRTLERAIAPNPGLTARYQQFFNVATTPHNLASRLMYAVQNDPEFAKAYETAAGNGPK